MTGRKLMYDALLAQCNAEKTESLFTIDNYMCNSVGIGEHPQQVEEILTHNGWTIPIKIMLI